MRSLSSHHHLLVAAALERYYRVPPRAAVAQYEWENLHEAINSIAAVRLGGPSRWWDDD